MKTNSMPPITTFPNDPSKYANKNVKAAEAGNFGDQLKKYLGGVDELQQVADKRIEEIATGQNANLHEAMIAVERAGISFRVLTQVRNKIVAAYEEVMRMGI